MTEGIILGITHCAAMAFGVWMMARAQSGRLLPQKVYAPQVRTPEQNQDAKRNEEMMTAWFNAHNLTREDMHGDKLGGRIAVPNFEDIKRGKVGQFQGPVAPAGTPKGNGSAPRK